MLPLLAGVLILGRIGLRCSRGLAQWSRGSGLKRVAAATLSAVVVTGLSWAWWPQPGTYRPIGPDEKGLLTAVLPAEQSTPVGAVSHTASQAGGILPAGASAQRRLANRAPLQATFPKTVALPSKADPQLAVVLVPSGEDGSVSPEEQDPTWVFPFDKPLPPAAGDNQAGAFNTTDDSVTYDIAFALVWATGDEVLNVNEAHAYASCSNCVTVAVAFQVVLIMSDARVVVPQNLSVAANYDCYRCITAAIASQLVLSVQETPGEDKLLALVEVWDRLTEFGEGITAYSLSQISAQLNTFKEEIIAILLSAPPMSPGATPTPTAAPSSPTASPAEAGSATPPTGSPPASSTAPSPSPAGASDPTATEPTAEPTSGPPTDTATATPSPEATTSPSPSP